MTSKPKGNVTISCKMDGTRGKGNKYFLGLEKGNFKNKCITKLSVNKLEITNPEEI